MVARQFSDDQCPSYLDGNILKAAFLGVMQALADAYPEAGYAHYVLPPSPTASTWKRIQTGKSCVAMTFGGWVPEQKTGQTFRGTLTFPVFLLIKHNRIEDLWLGTNERWGAGTLGLIAQAIGHLHGAKVPGLDATMRVTRQLCPAGIDWLDEKSALAELEIQIEGVGLDTEIFTDQLPDFLRLSEIWTVDGAAQPQATLNVRENP
ncbi:hypothetical protein HK14_01085 [Acetobacter cibinongensis]|uniref:Uncharacterized protein n=1 Tax=Acetobacter cibinongensis TaxID=146475 RepID=A0A1Z5YR46_9PROT|nr:hypothetical protein HK14_01085 [Acetobacter cibinongensis]